VAGPVGHVDPEHVRFEHVAPGRPVGLGGGQGGAKDGRRGVQDDRFERVVEVDRVAERPVRQRSARWARRPAPEDGRIGSR
jgi:hypothetical protein